MKMMKRLLSALLVFVMVLLAGCAVATPERGARAAKMSVVIEDAAVALSDAGYTDTAPVENVDLTEEAAALIDAPAAVPTVLMPEASGVQVKKAGPSEIDYSNTADGYVMVRYNGETAKRLKAQVKGPGATYTYNITPGETWTTLPLTAGNGSYQITVYKNVTGNKYAAETSVKTNVNLADEFAPYLRPNQYVNYEAAPNTIAKAAELTAGLTDTMAKVEKVYDYVVDNLSYDYNRAATVRSGYLPVLDSVLAEEKGICFDYAALMTGMLRSQGIPCRLLIGYAGTQYHAWISVWTAEQGWVDGVIRFNGTSWQRMDPTYASTSNRHSSIMNFIASDSNYTVSYQY